jgi:hypothetical protein
MLASASAMSGDTHISRHRMLLASTTNPFINTCSLFPFHVFVFSGASAVRLRGGGEVAEADSGARTTLSPAVRLAGA